MCTIATPPSTHTHTQYRVLFDTKLFRQVRDITDRCSAKPKSSSYTPSVPTDGSYGIDTVDSGAGDGGESGGGDGDDIEDRVVNRVTTNNCLRDQLFKRPASVQPE